MWTDKKFWMDSSWRAFRTFCQTLAAVLGGQTVNVLTTDWYGMLGVSGGAALMSILMSVDRERAVLAPGVHVTEGPALQAGYSGDLR